MSKPFPLTLFEFTYLNCASRIHRIVFVWTARDREDADEAFKEVLGLDPKELEHLKVQVKKCEGWPRGKMRVES